MPHNSTSGQVMSFVLYLEAKELKEMSIARWSELLNCVSALSTHARTYSAHPLNPCPQMLKQFPLQFTFKWYFHCFFVVVVVVYLFVFFFTSPGSPALTFTLKLLVVFIVFCTKCKKKIDQKQGLMKYQYWNNRTTEQPSQLTDLYIYIMFVNLFALARCPFIDNHCCFCFLFLPYN